MPGPTPHNAAVFDILRAVAGVVDLYQRRRCPVPYCPARKTTGNMIAHLNDGHHWTREHIADWVETIERAEADAAVDPHATDPGTPSTREKALSS